MTKEQFFNIIEAQIKTGHNPLCSILRCTIIPNISNCPLAKMCPYINKTSLVTFYEIDNFILKQYQIYKSEILAEKLK